jgi:pilus assembly protein CpaB
VKTTPATRSLPFVVSIGVAALGAALLAIYIRQFQLTASGGAPVRLLAFRKDVPAGALIDEEMLITHVVPESYVESRQVLASEKPKVLGVRTAIDLEANQTLAWTDLVSTRRERSSLSARIPSGMRAMSIEQPARKAFGQLLRPGDRVDVLLTKVKPGSEHRTVTIPLLQNILVLAVGNNVGATYSEVGRGRTDFVTLLLTVDQASLLAHAKQDGHLALTLRNENDIEITEGLLETDDLDVLERERRVLKQRRVLIERVD